MTPIDFNADLAEGSPHDAELLSLVTSANVACGVHAGTPDDIRRTLRQIAQLGRPFGVHPGYADREHFGRRELDVSADELHASLLDQCDVVRRIASEWNLKPEWLKPHGGLYHRACRGDAEAIVVIGVAIEQDLAVVGLPDCALSRMCEFVGVKYIPEGFADRRCRADGTLVPRSEPDATISDPDEAAERVLELWASGRVRTICVHGDRPEALAFLRAIRERLGMSG